MLEDKDKIITRIKKLLALSQSPNEHEAISAAEKAQAILATYNLSMADVTLEEADEFVIDNEIATESAPWKRQVAVMTAKMYFCTYFYTQKNEYKNTRKIRRDMHSFVGAKHNIVIAKMMFMYLVTTIERLALEGKRKSAAEGRDTWGNTYRRSFSWACACRVGRRIQDRIDAAKRGGEIKAESGNTLPALASLYDQTDKLLKEHLAKKVGRMRQSKRRGSIHDLQGAADGYEAGNKIGLDQQVGSHGNNLRLGK